MDSQLVGRSLGLTAMGAAGTAIGGLMVVVHPNMGFRRLGILQGLAAGLMFGISFLDLVPEAVEELGFLKANIWLYVGVLFFASIAHLVPEPDATKWIDPKALKGKRDDKHAKAARKKMLLSGLITAVGIAIHNFPEGISVFLASAKSPSLGLSLAVSIAMHNIPEGVAVALPVYCATQSKWLALKMTVLSGLAEPLAVVVVGGLLPPGLLSQGLVMEMLAAVGGIMAYITMHELVPLALTHASAKEVSHAFFLGMALMSLNLWLIHGDGHEH